MRCAPTWFVAVASLVVPSVALAGAGFQVNEIDFSGMFSPSGTPRGGGIFFPNAYQLPDGNNFPPSPMQIQANPDLEFDSYVAFGGRPATAGALAFSPPETPAGFTATAGFFDTGDSLQGAVFASQVQPGNSQVNPATSRESFFFARITIPTESIISGSIEVDIVGEDGPTFYTIDLTPPGADMGMRGFREFRVYGQKTEENKELPLPFEEGRGTTGFFDVYDFYIELVPAPGAVALFGVGALTLTRRRR